LAPSLFPSGATFPFSPYLNFKLDVAPEDQRDWEQCPKGTRTYSEAQYSRVLVSRWKEKLLQELAADNADMVLLDSMRIV